MHVCIHTNFFSLKRSRCLSAGKHDTNVTKLRLTLSLFLHHELWLFREPLWRQQNEGEKLPPSSMLSLHWTLKRKFTKSQLFSVAPLWAKRSYLGVLVFLDYVLNKPTFEPQKGQAGAGLVCRGLLCLGVGLIPWFLFTPPPHPQLLPRSQFIL
jgi:hypothetical protein